MIGFIARCLFGGTVPAGACWTVSLPPAPRLINSSPTSSTPCAPSTISVSMRLRYAVLTRDGGRCVLCGRSSREGAILQVDHIVPKSWGKIPVASLDDLQTLCRECNLGKSNLDDTDWR